VVAPSVRDPMVGIAHAASGGVAAAEAWRVVAACRSAPKMGLRCAKKEWADRLRSKWAVWDFVLGGRGVGECQCRQAAAGVRWQGAWAWKEAGKKGEKV
jgi:hypothetical protein